MNAGSANADKVVVSAVTANADKGVVSAVCSSFQTEEGMRLREKLQLVAGKQNKMKNQDDGTRKTKVHVITNSILYFLHK